MDEITITRHVSGDSGEYQAHVPGTDTIGRLTWTSRDDVRVAEHTLVPPEIGGRGIAGKLVEALIADARSAGFRITPQCSYVAKAFEKHPDWAPLRA